MSQQSDYYNQYNPFLSKVSQQQNQNSFKRNRQIHNNQSVGNLPKYGADKYHQYEQMKIMQMNHPHMRVQSLPKFQQHYGVNNNDNDRFLMPSVSPIVKGSKKYISQQENSQNEKPSKINYSSNRGLVIKFDTVTNLPENLQKVGIELSVQNRKGYLFHTGKTDIYPSNNNMVVSMYERKIIKGIQPDPETYLYIELQGKSQGHKEFFEVTSFSKLFNDNQNLNEGCFKIPLYSMDQDPISLLYNELDQQQQKHIRPETSIFLNIRISNVNDKNIDNYNKLDLKDYITPSLYKKQRKRDSVGVNGNPKSKIKVQPLKKKYDMDQLTKHMDDMKNIREQFKKQEKEKQEYRLKNPADQSQQFNISKNQRDLESQDNFQNSSFANSTPYVVQKFKPPSKYHTGKQYGSYQQAPRLIVKNPGQKVKILSESERKELEETNNQRAGEEKGGIFIQCFRMENFQEDNALAFDMFLLGPEGKVLNRYGEVCEDEADKVYDGDPSDNVCHMDLTFNILKNPYDLLKDEHNYNQYYIVFNFMAEDEDEELPVGWYAHQLFDGNKKLNEGLMTENIFKNPLQENVPFNQSKIKRDEMKFVNCKQPPLLEIQQLIFPPELQIRALTGAHLFFLDHLLQ